MVEHLVFLDESGVNTNLTRLYGRALSSQRAVDHAPLNTPQTTTVLSSIRLNGEKAFTTYQGGTTGERFVQYLKETLLPTLKPGDIVVMDNMRSHHVKAVREVLEEKGMKVLYLPPYSPDLNPIEKMWSKMKALLVNAHDDEEEFPAHQTHQVGIYHMQPDFGLLAKQKGPASGTCKSVLCRPGSYCSCCGAQD